MNKAGLAATSLNERLKSLREDFVCLITEPYNFKGKAASLPSNAQIVPENTEEHASRAIIMASPNCEVVEVRNLCTKDSAVAHCKIDKVNILLCSVYMDVTMPVQQDFLNKIMDYADSKNVEIIMGIDTNSHSTIYGDDTNSRGKDMEEFIIDNGLSVENIGKIPTFETIRGNLKMATCIDVTLSRGLDNKIAKWTVDQTYNGSDHNTITFEITRKNLKMEKTRNGTKETGLPLKGEYIMKTLMNRKR